MFFLEFRTKIVIDLHETTLPLTACHSVQGATCSAEECKRQPVGVKRTWGPFLHIIMWNTPPSHPSSSLSLSPLAIWLRQRAMGNGEREKDRERFHLIDKEFCLQVVLNLASQPLTPMWTGNALAGTLKRAVGQGRGLGYKQTIELFKEAADYAEV